MSQTMLFQNFYISLKIWIPAWWFPLPPPAANVALLLTDLCWTVGGFCSVCTVCSRIAVPVANAEFDVTANIMVKSKQLSIFVPFWLL